MGKRFLLGGLSAGALLWAATLAQAESVDEVSRLITEKARAIKSLAAKTHVEVEKTAPGYADLRNSDGAFQLVRKDGQVLVRNESREVARMQAIGAASKQEGVTLTIIDGSGYVYTYIEAGDQRTAYKTAPQVDWDANPVEIAKAACDVELLPDETFDGAPVYVFKLTPKPGSGGEGCAIQYFRKDCGFPVKIVHLDPASKPLMTVVYTDIKLDQDINPGQFVFTPPEGVTVIDLTQIAPAPASAPASAPGAPEPSAASASSVPQTAPADAAPVAKQTTPAEPASQPAASDATNQPAPPEATSQPAKAAENANKGNTKKSQGKKVDSKKSEGKKGKQKTKP